MATAITTDAPAIVRKHIAAYRSRGGAAGAGLALKTELNTIKRQSDVNTQDVNNLFRLINLSTAAEGSDLSE